MIYICFCKIQTDIVWIVFLANLHLKMFQFELRQAP